MHGLQELPRVGSVAAAPTLYSAGSRVGTLVVSDPAEREIFPDQGLNQYLLHWQVDSLLLNHQGSPPLSYF